MIFVPASEPGIPATFLPDDASAPAHVRADPSPPKRANRQAQDTIAGCRESARADLATAAGLEGSNAALKYEHSAASWTARADLLQRLDDSHVARTSAVVKRAERERAAS